MSHSKIASIVLYVIIVITIPIMLLFFSGNSLVNQSELDVKVNKMENPDGKTTSANLMKDLTSADSLAAGSDSAKVVTESIPVVTSKREPVKLSFMESLVYHKTDVPLIWAYVLLIVTIIITLTFPIIYLFFHPTNLLRTFLVLIGVAILVGLAYLISSGEPMQILGYTGTANSNPVVLKIIDTGLIFSYFMFGLTLLSILFSEVSKYFK